MEAGGSPERLDRLLQAAGRVHRGPEKVTTLERAIADHVRPGMHLHLTSGLTRPQATTYELVRAFAGRDPRFTLSAMSLAGPNNLLVTEGLVTELICTFHGETLPTPGPNPAVQRAHAAGAFEVSAWSILSFTQRLLAGALRLPWMPTNSLRGSSMEAQPDVVAVDGELCVRSLVPDVAFVHAPAADAYGNVLLGGPFGDGCLGAWAATEGAIVTVERVVPTEVVAAHSPNMRLPAACVGAVVEAPFGAHPGPLYSGGVTGVVAPIAEDSDFVTAFREACATPETLEAWTKTWVHGAAGGYPRAHETYLARIGPQRLSELRGRAQPDSWLEDAHGLSERILRPDPPLPGELAVVGGARELAARIRSQGLRTVLAGVGQSNLAAWLARAQLAAEGVHVSLMVELGLFDYVPPAADPLLVTNRVAATAMGLVGVLDILGSGLASTPSAGILGAGQVDRRGNINSSRTSGGGLLVGSGGSNDVASICRDVVVVAQQAPGRFVSEVPYITAPGGRVSCLVTQHGRYEKDDTGELVLTGVWGEARDGVARARAGCSFDLGVAGEIAELAHPTEEELGLVRAFDPRAEYTG